MGVEHVPMKFALFYEIPVAQPWGPDSERIAYHNTIAQAIAGDRFGWDAFWTVEHHFLDEYSHCSNPEVLYGAIAAQTERIRLGYGVRLLQKPHPPMYGATSSEEGHRQVGELGLGLCSFAVGVSPEEVKKKIDIYRAAIERCEKPIGKFVNNQAATFTMTLCSPDRAEALE